MQGQTLKAKAKVKVFKHLVIKEIKICGTSDSLR